MVAVLGDLEGALGAGHRVLLLRRWAARLLTCVAASAVWRTCVQHRAVVIGHRLVEIGGGAGIMAFGLAGIEDRQMNGGPMPMVKEVASATGSTRPMA